MKKKSIGDNPALVSILASIISIVVGLVLGFILLVGAIILVMWLPVDDVKIRSTFHIDVDYKTEDFKTDDSDGEGRDLWMGMEEPRPIIFDALPSKP